MKDFPVVLMLILIILDSIVLFIILKNILVSFLKGEYEIGYLFETLILFGLSLGLYTLFKALLQRIE